MANPEDFTCEKLHVTCQALEDRIRLRARVAELENANVEQGAILESIMGALKGEEPSDFMRSFPDVEHAWWVYRLAYPTAK